MVELLTGTMEVGGREGNDTEEYMGMWKRRILSIQLELESLVSVF